MKKSSENDDNTSSGTVIRHDDVMEKDGFSSASKVWEEIRSLQENLRNLQESNNAKVKYLLKSGI